MTKGLLLIVLGLAFFALGEWSYLRMKKCQEEVSGKVVGIQSYKGAIKWSLFTSLTLVVEYTYKGVQMSSQTLNSITCLTPGLERKLTTLGYAVGSSCTIKVNPEKPSDICTRPARNLLFVLFALLFILIGLAMCF